MINKRKICLLVAKFRTNNQQRDYFRKKRQTIIKQKKQRAWEIENHIPAQNNAISHTILPGGKIVAFETFRKSLIKQISYGTN